MDGKITVSVSVDFYYAEIIATIMAVLSEADPPEIISDYLAEALTASIVDLIDLARDMFSDLEYTRLQAIIGRSLTDIEAEGAGSN
jgi:hypothetical protein